MALHLAKTLFLASSTLPSLVQSGQFLAQSPPQVEDQLVLQIEALFGQGAVEGRVARLEGELRSMYDSLPKDHSNRLGKQGVQYALHRYFTRFHGMHVDGLMERGSSSADTSPVAFLEGRVPRRIKEILEYHLSEKGFGIRELASLASVLELLVRAELSERLTTAYSSLGFDLTGRLSEADVEQVLAQTSREYILEGMNLSDVEKRTIPIHSMESVYPGWTDMLLFNSDTRMSKLFHEQERTNPFQRRAHTFDEVMDIATAVNDNFGKFQNHECGSLKDALLSREQHGTGRIRVKDFYRMALEGEGHFTETPEILRDLGILDESTPHDASVIVVNYVQAKTNCLASSSFYSVCCFDECEDLLGHLEEQFTSPDVAPERILQAIARLHSSTVAAPRNISKQLTDRLHQVAAFHGGMVPLHGRLFAQWMHHAYPRECAYPHQKGPTQSTDLTAVMSQDDMLLYLGEEPTKLSTYSRSGDGMDDDHHMYHIHGLFEPAPWTDDEEFFADRWPPSIRSWWGGASIVRQVAMVAVVVAMVINMAHLGSGRLSKDKAACEKQCV